MKVLVLTAKEKNCFCEETVCNPDACPYAKGHFDRINDAIYDLYMKSYITAETAISFAHDAAGMSQKINLF